MISEDYCSYEVAKLLKEKGFDEKTLSYYEDNVLCHGDWYEWNRSPLGHIAAPTLQMAMKWLREEKYVLIFIVPAKDEDGYLTCCADVWTLNEDEGIYEPTWAYAYYVYEKAVDAALQYSLENLI